MSVVQTLDKKFCPEEGQVRWGEDKLDVGSLGTITRERERKRNGLRGSLQTIAIEVSCRLILWHA